MPSKDLHISRICRLVLVAFQARVYPAEQLMLDFASIAWLCQPSFKPECILLKNLCETLPALDGYASVLLLGHTSGWKSLQMTRG